jgi:ribA/ribD-fused uncharacterized protein
VSAPVVIGKVAAPYGELGNMSRHPIRYGVLWPRAEHLFQALRFRSPALREEIRKHSNPMRAKMAAKKLRKENPEDLLVVPLGEEDVMNMRIVLRLKVEQHKEVADLLLSTSRRFIVEDCTRRQRGSGLFWGAALNEHGQWEGKNMLGKLWMELRGELRCLRST